MKEKGFTIVELLVSVGILMVLFALTTINLNRLPSSTAQSSSIDRLTTDLKGQQTKSMAGYNAETYGIHFETTSYTVFTGTTYSQNEASNYIVDLDPNLSFTSVTFPGSQVIFLRGSGDTTGGTVTIADSLTGDDKTLQINKYGATY